MRWAIFVCLFSLAFADTVRRGCPSMCNCSDSLVACRGEELEVVPNFESLEVEPLTIDLSGNSIFDIAPSDFSFDGVESVQYLYLNNNHIVNIQENAFSELTSLKEINLNSNGLDRVPPMFVVDNTQLVSLDLSNNMFDDLTPEIFSDSLEALDLSFTKIGTFTEANIKYLPNLKVLNLSYNRLKAIDYSVFDKPSLLAVDLTGNFWNCDKKTIELFDFLTDKGLMDILEPVKCVTEDGFYQDIYTSEGAVDIFSISLETADQAPAESDEEPEVAVNEQDPSETQYDSYEPLGSDADLQDDNQEALNANAWADAGEEKDQDEKETEASKELMMIEHMLEEKSSKNSTDDVADDVFAWYSLEYSDDYNENVDPEEESEKLEDNTKAIKDALKVIEEEENKEDDATSEAPEDAGEMEISVIREDQYIVLLESNSPTESRYSYYFTNNIVSLLGVMVFVLTFIAGIILGFCAIRGSLWRKRSRDINGSTHVLIDKWSEEIA